MLYTRATYIVVVQPAAPKKRYVCETGAEAAADVALLCCSLVSLRLTYSAIDFFRAARPEGERHVFLLASEHFQRLAHALARGPGELRVAPRSNATDGRRRTRRKHDRKSGARGRELATLAGKERVARAKQRHLKTRQALARRRRRRRRRVRVRGGRVRGAESRRGLFFSKKTPSGFSFVSKKTPLWSQTLLSPLSREEVSRGVCAEEDDVVRDALRRFTARGASVPDVRRQSLAKYLGRFQSDLDDGECF